MSEPNLGRLNLHAYGRVTAAGVLSNGVNVLSVVKGAAGLYTVNLGSEIDPTQRYVAVGVVGAVGGFGQRDAAGDTDSALAPRTFNVAGAATDLDFEFFVYRTNLP